MVLIYSEPLERWKCAYKECHAQCCREAREVTAGDIRRIASVTSLEPEEFAEVKGEKGLFKLKVRDGGCFFLKGDSCELHGTEAKPIFCRMYPFKFDGIIYSDEVVLKVKALKECPGFGRGEGLADDFEANIEALGNKFVREIKEYLKLKHEGLSTQEILEAV